MIVEIKSALGDLQETLGRLDVKVRLGRQLAHDLGWTDVRVVIPALALPPDVVHASCESGLLGHRGWRTRAT